MHLSIADSKWSFLVKKRKLCYNNPIKFKGLKWIAVKKLCKPPLTICLHCNAANSCWALVRGR